MENLLFFISSNCINCFNKKKKILKRLFGLYFEINRKERDRHFWFTVDPCNEFSPGFDSWQAKFRSEIFCNWSF